MHLPQGMNIRLLPDVIVGHTLQLSIAVLDTGLSLKHPALQNCVVASSRSFTGDNPEEDLLDHGTGSCGLLAARAGFGGASGLVPDVPLHIGQVMGSEVKGDVYTLCEGLRWATTLGVDIIAIPTGLRSHHPELEAVVTEAVSRDILIFAAVGNPYYLQCGPLYPAAYSEVVAVGCSMYHNDYLSWSRPPDLILSAHNISTCTAEGGWRLSSGTSVATIKAAGLACQVLKSWENTTRSSRSILRGALLTTIKSIE